MNGIIAIALVNFTLSVPKDGGEFVAINPLHVVSIETRTCPSASRFKACVYIWKTNDRIDVVASTYEDAVARLNAALGASAR